MEFNFGSAFDGFSAKAEGATKGIRDGINSLLDPSAARLAAAKLLPGGAKHVTKPNAQPAFHSDDNDWRVKVSLAKGANYFYKAATQLDRGILAPLKDTGGVIFPYTPNISITHTARYGSNQLTHSNYTNYSYEGSEVQAFTIAGDFTAQNRTEAAYVLACIHFFRSATKMWFGGGANVGSPPPMVFLTGYGANYFPNVPCVITSFQHTMPQDVDYIQAVTSLSITSEKIENVNAAPTADMMGRAAASRSTISSVKEVSTRIPTTSQISITVQPIYSRKNIYNNFNLDKFAQGELLGSKDTGAGGFI